jgi:hypothetical protein
MGGGSIFVGSLSLGWFSTSLGTELYLGIMEYKLCVCSNEERMKKACEIDMIG